MAAWSRGGRGRDGRGDQPRARDDGGQMAQPRGAMAAGGVHGGSLFVARGGLPGSAFCTVARCVFQRGPVAGYPNVPGPGLCPTKVG